MALIGVLAVAIGAVAASQISIPSIPPGDPVNDPAWPLSKRVGVHIEALRAVIEAYNAGVPTARRVELAGLPDMAELMKPGLGAFLR